MSSGMAMFAAVGVILGVAIYLNYRMSQRNKRHEEIFESDALKFDKAVERNDLPEIERI